MKKLLKSTLVLSTLIILISCNGKHAAPKYKSTWQSVEQVNPVPDWFKDAKFGIYFHWGVFSVPAYANEWYPRNMYFKGSAENQHHIETYGETDKWPYNNFITGAYDKAGNFVQFAPKLKSNGGNFDPDEWAQLFSDAGAKFAGPVAEHHDGFSMWASKVNPWNSVEMGPKLDLLRLFADAIRKKDMRLFISLHHAYNISGYYEAVPQTDDPKLQMLFGQQGKEKNEEFWLNKLKEVIDNYQPDIIYQDFNLSKISDTVLLQFLSYYYNKGDEWNNGGVVATYKDAFNKKCALLDFERGGPTDLTDYYWLTDDAISSSSWCYTEGIGYYSKKQILHALIDRVSKNGNFILNISPKADGTIPQEQKDVLLAIGDWLKKYGEAIYSTRAWEKYGEGPTKMGAGHGVFTTPSEGTAKDVRYTRSKDNTTLYAILLDWNPEQKEVILHSLSSLRIDLKSLKNVSLISSGGGKYIPLKFNQDTSGLIISLPERQTEEMAYVLKLSFDGTIPKLDKYINLDCSTYYFLSPGEKTSLSLGLTGKLSVDLKNPAQQWKLEKTGRGIYEIINRLNPQLLLECIKTSDGGLNVRTAPSIGKDNQQWKIEASFNGLLKITNKEFADYVLQVNGAAADGSPVNLVKDDNTSVPGWQLLVVCDLKETGFKTLTIPGTIEAEDYDMGCPGDAYYDKDLVNTGGKYRPNDGVDIQECSAGGYNTGWANTGEWMNYTVTVVKNGNYKVTIYFATVSEGGKLHIEFDGQDKTGVISVMNTGAYQNWQPLSKTLTLQAGKHIMKIYIDEASSGINLDKIKFTEE
jgi:alpha-L-fucosidase